MNFPNIALVGEAGSGKSTLANLLIARRNYARVALANPVKVSVGRMFLGPLASPDDCLAFVQTNKATLRGLFQEFATANRQLIDVDKWVRMAMLAAATFNASSRPVVVDDCRFLNEADHFRRAGWVIIRIYRPQPEGDTISREQRQHVSESEARKVVEDFRLYNDSTTENLYRQYDRLAQTGGAMDTLRWLRQQQMGGF